MLMDVFAVKSMCRFQIEDRGRMSSFATATHMITMELDQRRRWSPQPRNSEFMFLSDISRKSYLVTQAVCNHIYRPNLLYFTAASGTIVNK